MYLKLEVSIRQLFNENGVIKVAGAFSVDGHDGQMAKIPALPEFSCGDDRFHFLGFFKHLRREAVGEVKLANDHLHVDPKIVCIAENFDDPPAGILGPGRPIGDFYVHHDIL